MSLWNNTDSAASKPKSLAAGQVLTINWTGGTGYTNGAAQAMTLSAPPAGGVQATATATVAGGLITAINITNQGSGYTAAPTITAAPAGGSGAVFTPVIQAISKTTAGSATYPVSIIFLDSTEAALAVNRNRGLKLPGWTRYQEYVDNQGLPRYKVENLVAMSRTSAQAGDSADDVIAGDAAFSITSQPPLTASSVTGAVAGLTVVSAGSTFQWQVRQPAGSAYVNATGTIAGVTYVGGGTAATLVLSGFTAPNAGTKYRCQVFNSTANAGATSTVTTVAFGS